MTFERILSHFQVMKRGTGKAQCICPAHVDTKAKSLFAPEVMDDIKQAWAGAVHIWKNEDPELILSEKCMQQAKELQEANMADDGKRGIIMDYLEGKTQVCAREIWFEALK